MARGLAQPLATAGLVSYGLYLDTGVACNLQSYPIDSKWSFTYEPYGASDESGLAAETDQADGAQILRV